jgi:NADH-quinone oxidoreductase subunit L
MVALSTTLFCESHLSFVDDCFYMFRLLYLTFFNEFRGTAEQSHLHESPALITFPLIVLAI